MQIEADRIRRLKRHIKYSRLSGILVGKMAYYELTGRGVKARRVLEKCERICRPLWLAKPVFHGRDGKRLPRKRWK